mmetsp:Transcript_79830/g.258602  ORF Transcript_79830/g.258602 Transcript_79830/m.258602 type:complete len:106 (+) Transcript_79830:197-514(+)
MCSLPRARIDGPPQLHKALMRKVCLPLPHWLKVGRQWPLGKKASLGWERQLVVINWPMQRQQTVKALLSRYPHTPESKERKRPRRQQQLPLLAVAAADSHRQLQK